MNTLRIGIIGAGRIGRLHANNLKSRVPGAELVAVSDVYAPAAKAVAAALGIAAYGDYHDILSDPAVDAVFICSSTDTHSPISIEAARELLCPLVRSRTRAPSCPAKTSLKMASVPPVRT